MGAAVPQIPNAKANPAHELPASASQNQNEGSIPLPDPDKDAQNSKPTCSICGFVGDLVTTSIGRICSYRDQQAKLEAEGLMKKAKPHHLKDSDWERILAHDTKIAETPTKPPGNVQVNPEPSASTPPPPPPPEGLKWNSDDLENSVSIEDMDAFDTNPVNRMKAKRQAGLRQRRLMERL